MKQPKSLIQLIRTCHDDKTCREFLEEYRWQGMPICPHCQYVSDKHYRLKTKGEYNGKYKCRHCKKIFTVSVGTIFEGSHVPLDKWFYAIYVFLAHKKGISSIQLSKDIGVTQKTAWFMLNRIRHNLLGKELEIFTGIVQADETYIGGKNKGRIWQNQGRSLKQKIPVAGLLTDDKVYPVVVPDTSSKTLQLIIYALVRAGSTIVTDGWKGYYGLSNHYTHKIIEHSRGIYAKDGYHTNGIEGFWSHLKRGLKGIYHTVSYKHLQKYCNEFAYRYNTRKLSDMQRFMQFITAHVERLKYADLTYNAT